MPGSTSLVQSGVADETAKPGVMPPPVAPRSTSVSIQSWTSSTSSEGSYGDNRHARSSSMDSLESSGSSSSGGTTRTDSTAVELIPTRSIGKPTKLPPHNPLQFVKVQSTLCRKVDQQIKITKDIITPRETLKEGEEEWQSNLDNWKSRRRKVSEKVIQRAEEMRQIEAEEQLRQEQTLQQQRKIKKFSEIVERRSNRNYNLDLYIGQGDDSGLGGTPEPDETIDGQNSILRSDTSEGMTSEAESIDSDIHKSDKLHEKEPPKVPQKPQMRLKRESVIDEFDNSISSTHNYFPHISKDFDTFSSTEPSDIEGHCGDSETVSSEEDLSYLMDCPKTECNPESLNSETQEKLNGVQKNQIKLSLIKTEKEMDSISSVHEDVKNSNWNSLSFNMCIKPGDNRGFGFTLKGGKDQRCSAFVDSVAKYGPADSIGLKENDQIVSLNGELSADCSHASLIFTVKQAVYTGVLDIVVTRSTQKVPLSSEIKLKPSKKSSFAEKLALFSSGAATGSNSDNSKKSTISKLEESKGESLVLRRRSAFENGKKDNNVTYRRSSCLAQGTPNTNLETLEKRLSADLTLSHQNSFENGISKKGPPPPIPVKPKLKPKTLTDLSANESSPINGSNGIKVTSPSEENHFLRDSLIASPREFEKNNCEDAFEDSIPNDSTSEEIAVEFNSDNGVSDNVSNPKKSDHINDLEIPNLPMDSPTDYDDVFSADQETFSSECIELTCEPSPDSGPLTDDVFFDPLTTQIDDGFIENELEDTIDPQPLYETESFTSMKIITESFNEDFADSESAISFLKNEELFVTQNDDLPTADQLSPENYSSEFLATDVNKEVVNNENLETNERFDTVADDSLIQFSNSTDASSPEDDILQYSNGVEEEIYDPVADDIEDLNTADDPDVNIANIQLNPSPLCLPLEKIDEDDVISASTTTSSETPDTETVIETLPSNLSPLPNDESDGEESSKPAVSEETETLPISLPETDSYKSAESISAENAESKTVPNVPIHDETPIKVTETDKGDQCLLPEDENEEYCRELDESIDQITSLDVIDEIEQRLMHQLEQDVAYDDLDDGLTVEFDRDGNEQWLYYTEDSELLDDLTPRNLEPPREPPPPPPPPDVEENEEQIVPMTRTNSTKRIKKELWRRRSDFLGLDAPEGIDLDNLLPPPPGLEEILKQEREQTQWLEKRLSLAETELTSSLYESDAVATETQNYTQNDYTADYFYQQTDDIPETPEDISSEQWLENLVESEDRLSESISSSTPAIEEIKVTESPQHKAKQNLHSLGAAPKAKIMDSNTWITEKSVQLSKKPIEPVFRHSTYNQNYWLAQDDERKRNIQNSDNIADRRYSMPPTSNQHPDVTVRTWGDRETEFQKLRPRSAVWSSSTERNTYGPYSPHEEDLHSHIGINEDVNYGVDMLESEVHKCSCCGKGLCEGSAMGIEALRLYFHIDCFRCCVCRLQLGNGTCGTDVQVKNNRLYCPLCFTVD